MCIELQKYGECSGYDNHMTEIHGSNNAFPTSVDLGSPHPLLGV
jgi:hypothetical protein